MKDFWTGFEKRAGIFDFFRKGTQVAEQVAEQAAKKPGMYETAKHIFGDVADIAGKVKEQVDKEQVKKIINNTEAFTDYARGIAKAMKWPLVGLSTALTASAAAGTVGKVYDIGGKAEQRKYYENMNKMFGSGQAPMPQTSFSQAFADRANSKQSNVDVTKYRK